MSWVPAACLAVGAAAVGWPAGAARRRVAWSKTVSTAPRIGVLLSRGRAVVADLSPRRVLIGSTLGGALVALIAGGPVAAVMGAVYAWLGARALVRRASRRRAATERSRMLDDLAALVADLRAGVVTAQPAASRERRVASVWRLAEQTGAPAADLVERVEADARALDRAAASASAQAAGAQATALLLAGLPLGGIALGVAIGADPVDVLLHSPIGGACAVAAVLLQTGGLLWAERLTPGGAR